MVLVTGAVGFIGMHLSMALLARGEKVVGIDNLCDYYDPMLKQYRLDLLRRNSSFEFVMMDLLEKERLSDLCREHRFDVVYHLGAQAGVRYSIENPDAFVQSNLVGFLNILECCRIHAPRHLVYASSSSVYGLNKIPFDAEDGVDHPVSLYAATKKSNELMAHSYSHLFRVPSSGLRFFTVYGPCGRPDMAPWLFADAITSGRRIRLFNNGNMRRDFSYIDDVVEGIIRVGDKPPQTDECWVPGKGLRSRSSAPWRVLNIGNNHPVELKRFLQVLENSLGRIAEVEFAPMQPGDVEETSANIEPLCKEFDFRPSTTIDMGLPKFATWFLEWKELKRSGA